MVGLIVPDFPETERMKGRKECKSSKNMVHGFRSCEALIAGVVPDDEHHANRKTEVGRVSRVTHLLWIRRLAQPVNPRDPDCGQNEGDVDQDLPHHSGLGIAGTL